MARFRRKIKIFQYDVEIIDKGATNAMKKQIVKEILLARDLPGRTQINAGVMEMNSDELPCLVLFITSGLTWAPNIIGNEMAAENNQIETILFLRCPVRPKFLRGFTMWFFTIHGNSSEKEEHSCTCCMRKKCHGLAFTVG